MQTLSALLSWSHNNYLFNKTRTLDEYLWYAAQTIENGWSLSSLVYHVDTKTYERQKLSVKTTNYGKLLPSPQGDLATDTLKDPYVFDFIERRKGIIEREIKNELVANITTQKLAKPVFKRQQFLLSFISDIFPQAAFA